jgi:hypothetical protein
MGVTGITDGARKEWEPKRDYFVREVRGLLEKFRIWKDAEKKLLQEKEDALLAKEAEEEEDADAGAEDDESSNGGPDPSDVDAWAAMQLHQEAKSASAKAKPRRLPQRRLLSLPVRPPSPEKPFLSFYSKPHLRAAALGKSRHGRTVVAFGQPVADFAVKEFQLPGNYVTKDALRTNARKRRRLNRERKEGEDSQQSASH